MKNQGYMPKVIIKYNRLIHFWLVDSDKDIYTIKKHNYTNLLTFPKSLTIFALFVVSILFLIYILQFSYAQSNNANTFVDSNGNLNTNTIKLLNSNNTNLPDLNVSHSMTSTYRDNNGNLHIVGIILNNFTFPIQSINVFATLYNSNNQIITTGNTLTNIEQVEPKQSTGFNIIINNIPQNFSYYVISATHKNANISKPELLTTNLDKYYLDINGNYHITGKISNDGNNSAKFVKVTGIFLDANGKVVDSPFAYTISNMLKHGQNTSIDLNVSSPNAKNIKFSSLQVQSNEYLQAKNLSWYSTPSPSIAFRQALLTDNIPQNVGQSQAGGSGTGGSVVGSQSNTAGMGSSGYAVGSQSNTMASTSFSANPLFLQQSQFDQTLQLPQQQSPSNQSIIHNSHKQHNNHVQQESSDQSNTDNSHKQHNNHVQQTLSIDNKD